MIWNQPSAAHESPQWLGLIRRLEGYTVNLKLRVVPFRGGFQW